MLDYYDERNRVVTSALRRHIEKTIVFGDWIYTKPGQGQHGFYDIKIHINRVWQYDCYTNKTYKYVGMDLNTAKECVNAMKEIYTRKVKHTEWDTYEGEFDTLNLGGNVLMSDISMSATGGGMYEVVISVREHDTLTYFQKEPDFGYVEDRDYEEEEEE